MPPQNSLEELLRAGTDILNRAGVEGPRRDARLLAASALGRDLADLVALRGCTVQPDDHATFIKLIERRTAGEPVSRIVGRRGFWTMELALSPDVLDPRPDSECLIEAALSLVDGDRQPIRILDLGTGSGCLLLALLSEWPNATGFGVDISLQALKTAIANAREQRLSDRAHFVCANWANGVIGQYDLIISNPPYIATSDIAQLDREVAAYDPHLALDGGEDGLAAYRSIIPNLPPLLRPGGTMLLEIGSDQASAVKSLIERSNTKNVTVLPDLAGRNRCISAKKPLESEF